MLHILFLILKIAGILLLIVLGLLLLVLLSVLTVPVRYRGKGSFYKKPEGIFRITWCLYLLSIRISYREQLEIKVRIFGFPVFKEKEEPSEAEEKAIAGGEILANEVLSDVLSDDSFDEGVYPADYQEEPLLSAQELRGGTEDGDGNESPDPEKVRGEPEPKDGEPVKRTGGYRDGGKENFITRIIRKVKSITARLHIAFKNLSSTLKTANEKKEAAAAFLRDEENQRTFRLLKRQLKRVLRHILPMKWKGNITFGFDEPYTTGQVLSLAALLYPFYRDQIIIRPVFDRPVLEGELTFKGRIRMGTLLMAGVRILLNKNFRKQLKRFLDRGGM